MKLIVLFISALFLSMLAFASDIAISEGESTVNSVFVSLGSLVVAVPIIVQLLKKWFVMEKDVWKQVVAWIVSLSLVIIGKLFSLGMFIGLPWWETIVYGFAVGLASNGFFDIQFIKSVLQLLIKK